MTLPLALVIEDDPDIANVFSFALQLAGYATQIIEDGGLAIEQLNALLPALVVLDLNLPHVSGEAILQHIRAQARLAKTRVIIATAKDRAAEFLHHEADMVLIKPISTNQLMELAARLKPAASS
jgi:DNA-binding response OmpR family regulator